MTQFCDVIGRRGKGGNDLFRSRPPSQKATLAVSISLRPVR